MKKEDVIKKVSSTFNKVGIRLKKYSPEILVVAGVVGTVASAVIACHATTKLDTILSESKENIDAIHKCSNDATLSSEYTSDDAKKDKALVYIQTGFKVFKLYSPALMLGALSITSILASNNLLHKRNVALAAAYTTLDKTFKEYRSRVVERFGEEVDNELRNNIKAKKFEEVVVDETTGKEKKVKSVVNIASPTDEYARFFDSSCLTYEDNMDYNLLFLRSQQQIANDRLKADGFLFLSDIYEALGIKRTKMSQTVGWVYKPEGNPNGDNFIDFGVLETNRETENGYEKALLMNFNVDGPILNLI